MLDITFRTAAHRDIPAMRELLMQMDLGNDEPLTLETLERAFVSIQNNRYHEIYVAVINGEPRAMFTMLIIQQLAHNAGISAQINNVVVDSSLRGQGIGKQLIAFAIDRARSAGCEKIILTSNAKRVDAHRFYDQLGFKRHGLSFYYDLE
ncbi:GNAT family N-acetyltransferase [Phototrophicus methaneseepsis]|uniref:GNAT family N-acetyltransferase n=1 Tax=Phototrophicus methaneseepsis TaxID=2710758 RepID=A0A7S8IEG1_9CHLR|nr:GNAT family N-acetyltransferase [Phototrophicus methaneseepsis]QPC82409.1 GNAT family N-acetyltransferase [Phototrophicus methaneseepsis]